jgi:hypothetical protein
VTRFIVLACAVVLAACGGSSPGPLGVTGPPSAQSVADNSSDYPGLHKCPESGSYDHYLSIEQTANSDQYTTDKKTWDDLKASGANDSYIVVYVENGADCGQFGAGTPTGKVAYVYAIRFKDSSSAAASYKMTSKDFHVSDSEVSQLQTAGATVTQGTATGLGDNSLVLSIDVGGVSVFVAFWQNKEFEVAAVSFNMGTQAATASKSINERIR